MDEKFNFELFEAEKLPQAVSDENNNEPQNPEYNDITAGRAPKKKKKLPKKAKALMIICAVLACVIIAGAITLIYPCFRQSIRRTDLLPPMSAAL